MTMHSNILNALEIYQATKKQIKVANNIAPIKNFTKHQWETNNEETNCYKY